MEMRIANNLNSFFFVSNMISYVRCNELLDKYFGGTSLNNSISEDRGEEDKNRVQNQT